MSTLTCEKTICWGLNQIEMKMQRWGEKEWIDDLTINHSPVPLPEQERMWALDAKEMESFSKIDLKDVLWWMSIKDT
jgi:hypothetical protein